MFYNVIIKYLLENVFFLNIFSKYINNKGGIYGGGKS